MQTDVKIIKEAGKICARKHNIRHTLCKQIGRRASAFHALNEHVVYVSDMVTEFKLCRD